MNHQGDMLDRLRESADDGARNFRNVYIYYLAVALYIFVTILYTTNEMLLRAGDVSMPIINVGSLKDDQQQERGTYDPSHARQNPCSVRPQ